MNEPKMCCIIIIFYSVFFIVFYYFYQRPFASRVQFICGLWSTLVYDMFTYVMGIGDVVSIHSFVCAVNTWHFNSTESTAYSRYGVQ
jgi:hypothetical protein